MTFADNAGNQGTATLNVTVNNAPPPGSPTGSHPVTITRRGHDQGLQGRHGHRPQRALCRDHRVGDGAAEVHGSGPAGQGKKRVLAIGRLTLRGKHGGHGTIRVRLSANVKPGTYVIVVRETTLKGRKVGRLIKGKFTLR